MLKELKYLFYLIIIFFFLFFTLRYYFSDDNYKKSYRAVSSIDEKISSNENNLFILKNDTDNIIEYVEYKNKNTKKFSDDYENSIMNKVKRLKILYKNGTLSKSEFEKAKNKLLK